MYSKVNAKYNKKTNSFEPASKIPVGVRYQAVYNPDPNAKETEKILAFVYEDPKGKYTPEEIQNTIKKGKEAKTEKSKIKLKDSTSKNTAKVEVIING